MAYERQGFKNGQVLKAEHLECIENCLCDMSPVADSFKFSTDCVGKMIRVAAVDENGKPTKWETLDAAADADVLLIDEDVEFIGRNADIPRLPETEFLPGEGPELVEGATYIVTWNGVEYECVAKRDGYDACFIGNEYLGNDVNDTGEPFFIDSMGKVAYHIFKATSDVETISIKVIQRKKGYLPDGVPYVQTAAVGQTVVVSEVDADGKPTKWEAVSFPDSNANNELDTTLSVAGKAADAKAVGDALLKINNTTTEEVTRVVSVGSESVTIDSAAPNQTVNLAWAVSGSKNIPAFTNYYIEKSNISYPRTFNAAAYTQVWNVAAGHGNADTFVSGHQYFQALHYVMDGDGSANIMDGGSPQYITPTNSKTVTGSGWIYLLSTPTSYTSTAYGFNNTGTGTGTIDYLYCIDVTALQEAGTITATTINELAELFGGLELVPGQNYAGSVTSGEATLNITRDGETSTVDGGTATATVQGGDILSVEGGSVTFVLKVLKEVYNDPISVWADKKWVAFGDSLTDETINADKKYYRHIEKKTGINVVVMGVGGTGYAKNYGDGTSYGERMMSCPSDADVVTIFGSINDWGTLNTGGVQIGSPSDSLDAGTYSGYVNNCIDVAISKAPYAQIALVSPMFYRGIKPEIQESISSALKAVAEYRRVKFLDLYHDSGFRIENDAFAQAYTTDYSATDETFGHPSNLAHEQLIAPEFMELLRRMLLS